MNTQTLQGNWNVTKGKLKQKYAQLTDNDLVYVEGKEDELIGRIQKRVGTSRQEIENFLDACSTEAAGSSTTHEQRRGAAAPPERHVDTPLKRPVPASTVREASPASQAQQASASRAGEQRQTQQRNAAERQREQSRPQNTPSSRSPDAADQAPSPSAQQKPSRESGWET